MNIKYIFTAFLFTSVSIFANELSPQSTSTDDLFVYAKGFRMMGCKAQNPYKGLRTLSAWDVKRYPPEFPSEEAEGLIEAAKRAIAAHARVNFRDKTGYTPLMYAACSGYPKLTAYLVSQGAELANENGPSACELAHFMKKGFERSLELNPGSAEAYQEYIQRYDRVIAFLTNLGSC